MEEREDLLEAIQSAFRQGEHRFTVHAIREATAEGIAVESVRTAIMSYEADIVEDYPDDPRGASCLILGWMRGERPLHAVVSYPPDIAVITLYEPDPGRWEAYKTRR